MTRVAAEWWAGDFAVAAGELRPAVTRVQEHAGRLLGNPGIWILMAGGAPLVSLPPDAMAGLADEARGWSVAVVSDPVVLRQRLEGRCPRAIRAIVGPAYLGYGSAETLRLADARRARPIEGEGEALARLRAACSSEEWAHGGSDDGVGVRWGVFGDEGELRALAGYKVWNDAIAHLYVVTHPGHRGQGAGRAAVSAAAEHALQAGWVPQYRTLRANAPSMSVARRLGFVEYGFSVYVRLGGG